MKSTLFFLAGCFLFLPVFGQPSQSVHQEIERLHKLQDFTGCVRLEKEAELMARAQPDTLAANSFYYLGDAHYQLGSIPRAIEWFEREKNLRAGLGLTETEAYSGTLFNLSYLYLETGNYSRAGALASELIENDRKIYGPTSEVYIMSVLSTADVYIRLDKISDAEKLLKSTIRQQADKSLEAGMLLAKLGDLYTMSSRFSLADEALTDAVSILRTTAGEDTPEFLNALINRGILYMESGKAPEAEETFDYVLAQLSPEEPAYRSILNNQGLVYHSLGHFERASKVLSEIRALDSLDIGVTHPDFAITLTNLGFVYADEGRYADAERVLSQAIDIQKNNGEEETASYARKLNNLARVYRLSGKAGLAIPLHEQALKIFAKTLGKKSAEYGTTLYHLGMASWKNNNRKQAAKYLRSSASVREKTLGEKHPRYAETLERIAEFEWEQKKYKEAHRLYGEVFDIHYFQIGNFFPVLTEEEKAKFYYARIRPSFEKFNAFALQYNTIEPVIRGDMFNHHINTKASIMYATEKVRETIRRSGDTVLIREFDDWREKKEQISRLYSENRNPGLMDSLIRIAADLEKQLVRKSAAFGDQLVRPRLTWKDIQGKLNAGEAAIEIIRFNDFTPETGGRFAEKIVYAFLIVTKNTEGQPDLLVIDDGADLEGKMLNYYRNNIRFKLNDERSYATYVEPLARYLETNNIRRIFVSADGVYNQINIGGILNPKTQRYFSEDVDLRHVTNTRELVEVKPRVDGSSSLLIGYPKFDLYENEDAPQQETTRALTRGTTLSRGLRGGLLRYMRGEGGISLLPGTREEVLQIARLLEQPQLVMEANASEAVIKQAQNPRILHVATHGYFLEEEGDLDQESNATYVTNPLLKSGLILAGAENFLHTGIPVNDRGDDGILTAYEAMNLNLENTDLVVLSACETGLGVVKNGEGVYGLQRAFRIAGARNLIMSLWSVDDDATLKLMTAFYEHRSRGLSTPDAFNAAQSDLRTTHPHPFYWSAFVLLGI